MAVVDASVLVAYLGEGPKAPKAETALTQAESELLAPHLIDAEVGHALRRLAAGGELTDEEAEGALAELHDLPLRRSPHGLLLESAWAMRSQLSFYDALYAALALELDTELITLDGRLARAAGSLGVRTVAL
jgi:predicted nucleic acid-binding protein